LHVWRLRFDETSRFERQGTGLADAPEQLAGRYAETTRQRQDGAERRIALTVLDGPNIVGRQRRTFRKLLEREPEREPSSPNFTTKG